MLRSDYSSQKVLTYLPANLDHCCPILDNNLQVLVCLRYDHGNRANTPSDIYYNTAPRESSPIKPWLLLIRNRKGYVYLNEKPFKMLAGFSILLAASIPTPNRVSLILFSGCSKKSHIVPSKLNALLNGVRVGSPEKANSGSVNVSNM